LITAAKSRPGAPLAHKDVAAARQWLADHEERRRALAFVLAVHPLGTTWTHRQGGAHLGKELLGRFIEVDLRTSGIIGAVVNLQHVLHTGHEFGVGFGRDAPTLL
jgi:hypothetical protein